MPVCCPCGSLPAPWPVLGRAKSSFSPLQEVEAQAQIPGMSAVRTWGAEFSPGLQNGVVVWFEPEKRNWLFRTRSWLTAGEKNAL